MTGLEVVWDGSVIRRSNTDAHGAHRCESLYIELEDGRTISFESVPDIRFEIVPGATEEAVGPLTSNEPVLLDWSWQ